MDYGNPTATPQATPEAKLLADYLRAYGWEPQIERWDGHKHVDIWIPECRVNIEVDGIQHCDTAEQALADMKRTYHSFRSGEVTLHLPNALVRDRVKMEEAASYINEFLRESAPISL